MTDVETKKALQLDEAEKLLPLVLEIIPGHAAEGLIDIYEPGSYEGKSLKRLCDRTLNKKNLSISWKMSLGNWKVESYCVVGKRLMVRRWSSR